MSNQSTSQIDSREVDLEMNRLINKCVDSVFRKYNRSGDGRMTKDETLQFIKDSYLEQSELKS